MPSAIGHFMIGATIALPISVIPSVRKTVRPMGLIILSGLLGAAPDLDTIFFGVIPYAHFFGHRGFFHSLFFAVLLAVSLAGLLFAVSRNLDFRAFLGITASFVLSLASHGLLDAMTDAGLGVMLFFPFSKERFFLPWRLFYAPPINITRLSFHQVRLMIHSEWPIVLGCIAMASVVKFRIKRMNGEIRLKNNQ